MKTKLFLFLYLLSIAAASYAQSVTIGDKEFQAHPAALLEMQSTNKGLLVPRVSYTQRMYIPNSATSAGLLVYQTDKDNGFYYWDGLRWVFLQPAVTNELPNFAAVALSGDYVDLKNKPEFSPIATTGDYVDLKNKPEFSPIATTGDYNDLKNKPNLPSESTGLAAVALSGDYVDLKNKPVIPSRLQDLEQDPNYYSTITRLEREAWNTAAEKASGAQFTGDYVDLKNKPVIPSRLQDLEQDPNYYSTITRAEREYWNTAAEASSFSGSYNDLKNKPDLKMIATTGDYNDLTNKPNIPTELSNLATVAFTGEYKDLKEKPEVITELYKMVQDDRYAMYTTKEEKDKWNTAAVFATGTPNEIREKLGLHKIASSGSYFDLTDQPNIPLFLKDLVEDPDNQRVSRDDKDKWNTYSTGPKFTGDYNDLTNKPSIPSKLCDLMQDNNCMTTSLNQQTEWSAKLSMIEFNGLHTWSGLQGKPNDIVYTNDERLSNGRPPSGDANNGTQTAGDLTGVYPYPKIKENVSLQGIPTRQSSTSINAANLESMKASNELATTSMIGQMLSLSPAIGPASGDLTGEYPSPKIKENVILTGAPKAEDLDITTSKMISARENLAKEITNANTVYDMIQMYVRDYVLPAGAVIMWTGSKVPCGWEAFAEMNGRFPVAAGTGPEDKSYNIGDQGGAAGVILSELEIAPHQHKNNIGGLRMAGSGNQTGYTGWDGETGYSAYAGGQTVDGKHQAKSHENRPPYYAIYFIKKTNEVCPSNN